MKSIINQFLTEEYKKLILYTVVSARYEVQRLTIRPLQKRYRFFAGVGNSSERQQATGKIFSQNLTGKMIF
ncbi:MAG: hypothetical protein SWX82_35150 [Cyanobacteriota bacterium]|nr:hypothetical protein [Cyanobacteriota bacterium]